MIVARLTARARYAAGRAARKAAAAVALILLLAVPATAGTLRLVAVGDSLTSGYGLPVDQGFTAQLQRWLDEKGADVEVVNMGVAGDTSTGGLARLDWSLAGGADAVLVELGGNDLLRGTPPALTRANLDAILTGLGERGIPVLLAGLDIPLNFGLEWQVEFETLFAELAREHDALFYPSFLEGVWTRPELMQPDMLHPNAEGVARIVDGIGPLVLDLLESAEQRAAERAEK
jgi:acyl-CoA thioesterase-1